MRFASTFLVMPALVGCSSGDASSKYEQTWPKGYSRTSCDEWLHDMSSDQRFAAAADMLTGARNKGDGGTGLPPDSMIEEFEAGIDNVCVEPTMSLTGAGAGLYLTERSRFRP
jgi:hypothetical protein